MPSAMLKARRTATQRRQDVSGRDRGALRAHRPRRVPLSVVPGRMAAASAPDRPAAARTEEGGLTPGGRCGQRRPTGLLRALRSKVAVVTTRRRRSCGPPARRRAASPRGDRRSIPAWRASCCCCTSSAGASWSRRRPARLPARRHRRLGHRRRPDGVHARRPARVRRRPHRRDRQHHPQAGRRGPAARSAGFWFSLGHSSVVFAASLLLIAGVRSVADVVQSEDSQVGATLALVGTIVAGRVPAAHRADEPDRRRRHRPGLPPDARPASMSEEELERHLRTAASSAGCSVA